MKKIILTLLLITSSFFTHAQIFKTLINQSPEDFGKQFSKKGVIFPINTEGCETGNYNVLFPTLKEETNFEPIDLPIFKLSRDFGKFKGDFSRDSITGDQRRVFKNGSRMITGDEKKLSLVVKEGQKVVLSKKFQFEHDTYRNSDALPKGELVYKELQQPISTDVYFMVANFNGKQLASSSSNILWYDHQNKIFVNVLELNLELIKDKSTEWLYDCKEDIKLKWTEDGSKLMVIVNYPAEKTQNIRIKDLYIYDLEAKKVLYSFQDVNLSPITEKGIVIHNATGSKLLDKNFNLQEYNFTLPKSSGASHGNLFITPNEKYVSEINFGSAKKIFQTLYDFNNGNPVAILSEEGNINKFPDYFLVRDKVKSDDRRKIFETKVENFRKNIYPIVKQKIAASLGTDWIEHYEKFFENFDEKYNSVRRKDNFNKLIDVAVKKGQWYLDNNFKYAFYYIVSDDKISDGYLFSGNYENTLGLSHNKIVQFEQEGAFVYGDQEYFPIGFSTSRDTNYRFDMILESVGALLIFKKSINKTELNVKKDEMYTRLNKMREEDLKKERIENERIERENENRELAKQKTEQQNETEPEIKKSDYKPLKLNCNTCWGRGVLNCNMCSAGRQYKTVNGKQTSVYCTWCRGTGTKKCGSCGGLGKK